SDLVSSVLVLIGLVATRAGFAHADALAAIGVAFFIAWASYRLGRSTIDALVDRAPEGLADAIRALIVRDKGVAGIEAIRLRPSGARIVGDVVVSVARTLPHKRVAAIKAKLQGRIARRWPEAELTITANPLRLADETILERVLVIAARRGLPVHHVAIRDIEGRKTVALDLEVDRLMALGDAHRLASGLEDAIADEIGGGAEAPARHPRRAGAQDPRRGDRPFPLPGRSGDAGRDRSRRRRFARTLGQGRLSRSAPRRRARRARRGRRLNGVSSGRRGPKASQAHIRGSSGSARQARRASRFRRRRGSARPGSACRDGRGLSGRSRSSRRAPSR